MSTPNTPQSESHLTSVEEIAANETAIQQYSSEIIVDARGVQEIKSILETPTTIDTNESEQPTIPQLLQVANLPENTPVVEYTNLYTSADDLVSALNQAKTEVTDDGRKTTTSEFVDQKLASSQAFTDKVNASIAERDNQPETFYLATVTVADLGFENGATVQQIQDEIRKRKGIEFCKVEDAVIDHINDKDLRGLKSFMLDGKDIAYDTPEKDNDMLSDDGIPRVFARTSNDSERLLDARRAYAQLYWNPDNRVVLRLSKSDSDT